MASTEAELESFRRQWKEEVARNQTRSHAPPTSQASISTTQPEHVHVRRKVAEPTAATIIPRDQYDGQDEEAGGVSLELKGKEHGRRLDDLGYGESSKSVEPRTALEHYEKAVERETQGALGDSVGLYRKAFKLDSRVHESYKQKHFPASSFRPKKQPALEPPVQQPPADPNPSNAPVTVPNPAHASLAGLSPLLSSMIADFAVLRIQGEVPFAEGDPAPPCPIAELPEELLVEILTYVGISDVASFVRLAQVCKRLAYLVATEDRVWKRICEGEEFGFAAMKYRYACSLVGEPLSPLQDMPLEDELEELSLDSKPSIPISLTLTSKYPTYRQTFHSRPRLRFNGLYISTVNYTRPGASSTNSLSWSSPVLIVTYYRYLRFYRDGSCISLLTTAEPADVVHYLAKEYLPPLTNTGNRKDRTETSLPSAVMRDALRGRWRLSGDPYGTKHNSVDAEEESEPEGDVHIETEGVTPKYLYKMQLALTNASKGTRNNKLAWKGYWSYNRLTDDWAEFGLKNDRGFWFSRVKSYGVGLGAGV